MLGDLPQGNGDPHLTVFGKEVTPNQHQMANRFVDLDNFFVDGEISVLGHSFTTSGYASPLLEWLGNVGYADRLGAQDPQDKTKRKNFWPYNVMPGLFSPYYLWDALDDKGVDSTAFTGRITTFTPNPTGSWWMFSGRTAGK